MSQNTQSRQPAKRVFASELRAADEVIKPGNDERSPNYLVLPSGGLANRVFLVGTLTNVEEAGGGGFNVEVKDPTGTVRGYCGQYNPQPQSIMSAVAESDEAPPAYVTVVGKPDTFTPEDSDQTYVNLRPETINVYASGDEGNQLPFAAGTRIEGEDIRNRWISETIEQTISRLKDEDGFSEAAPHLEFDPAFAYREQREDIAESLEEGSNRLFQAI